MLFHASNNIVWRAKHISFTSQTILFRPRKSNLWKMECKNTGFHSPEGEWCQQIGKFRYAWCMYLPMSVGKGPVSVRFQNNAIPCTSASMCILRIAREGLWNPPNRILVRGRALWRASFDKMSKVPPNRQIRIFSIYRIILESVFVTPAYVQAWWQREWHFLPESSFLS